MRMKRKKKTIHCVSVSYPLSAGDLDDMLFEAAGKHSGASGAGFGYRDHSWYFKTRPAAVRMVGKLSTIPGIEVCMGSFQH